MLAEDLTLDPSTAIAAGTSSPSIYSRKGWVDLQSTVRSVASVALTAPENLKIAHSTRSLKGLKTQANASVPAPDVIIDRHLVRLDINVPTTTHLDPEYKIIKSVQLVIEVPRLGVASSPTAAQIADDVKSVVSMLCASSNANLVRLLNNES